MIGKLTQIASIYGHVCVCVLCSFRSICLATVRCVKVSQRTFNRDQCKCCIVISMTFFYQPMCTELQQLEINFIYICCAKFDLRQANCLLVHNLDEYRLGFVETVLNEYCIESPSIPRAV